MKQKGNGLGWEEHQRAEDGDVIGRGVGRGAAEASCTWRCHCETLVCWHKSKPIPKLKTAWAVFKRCFETYKRVLFNCNKE